MALTVWIKTRIRQRMQKQNRESVSVPNVRIRSTCVPERAEKLWLPAVTQGRPERASDLDMRKLPPAPNELLR
jgi:hypothetical protein